MRLAPDHSDFGGRPAAGNDGYRIRFDTTGLQGIEQCFPVNVVSDEPDKPGFTPERRYVRRGIGCSSRPRLRFVMFEDENRGLARNAGYGSEQELVGDNISDDGDTLSFETKFDPFRQGIH